MSDRKMGQFGQGKCANCKRVGIVEQDHIIPRRADGLHDRSNIQLLCPNCHSDKNVAEDKKYGRVRSFRKTVSTKVVGKRTARVLSGKRGRPRKFINKKLIHVWVEEDVQNKVIELATTIRTHPTNLTSWGDIVALAVDRLYETQANLE